MTSVVLELQHNALDKNVKVSDLLRKALVVARKLGLREFQEWIGKELNGYEDSQDTPAYREVSGEIKGWNPYNGWIPLIFQDSKIAERLSRRKTNQSIARLENLVEAQGDKSFHMPFPQNLQRKLSKGFGYETQVTLIADSSSIVGIVDSVRTIILNWALKLEEDGILGEEMSFSADEKNAASRGSQNVTNFYGPVQMQHASPQSIQVSASHSYDIEAIRKIISELQGVLDAAGLISDTRREIEAELTTLGAQIDSPKPKPPIIRETLLSIRSILEGASGGAVAHVLIEIGKVLAV